MSNPSAQMPAMVTEFVTQAQGIANAKSGGLVQIVEYLCLTTALVTARGRKEYVTNQMGNAHARKDTTVSIAALSNQNHVLKTSLAKCALDMAIVRRLLGFVFANLATRGRNVQRVANSHAMAMGIVMTTWVYAPAQKALKAVPVRPPQYATASIVGRMVSATWITIRHTANVN